MTLPSAPPKGAQTWLVTAIGSMSAPAVIAGLRRGTGGRIIGCDLNPAEWLASSSLVDGFHQVPSARQPEAFVEALLRLCRENAVAGILPLTDPEIDALLPHRETFVQVGVALLIPASHATRTCRDKWELFRAFEGGGEVAPIPTWRVQGGPARPAAFPWIAKPRRGRSSEGLVSIRDTFDEGFARERLAGEDYIVQQWLPGEVCVVDVVRHGSSGRVATMARRELLRTPNGAGLTVELLPPGELNRLAKRVVERLDINGCINLEFLVHDGVPLLMDANPRFSAGVGFSLLGGYDMISNHLRCFGMQDIDDEVVPAAHICTRSCVDFAKTTGRH